MAEPQQGMRRRYMRWNEQDAVPPPQLSSNADQEARASLTRFSANPDVVRGLYNRLTGDDAAAEAAYGRALQTQQESARQDSDVSTNWRDWGGVGDAAAGVRKVLIGSAPDMALALGAGGIGRGVARRTVGNIERRAAVQQVEQRLADQGIDSLVGRQVAGNAARKPAAAAATPQVAQAQFQDAIERTGADLVRRAPGAQGRIDAAGRAGFIAGSTAGAFPGIAAQDTQELMDADREGTLRMLPYQIGQAALEPLVEARLAGRAIANPYVKKALQEGVGATRGALSKLPGRIAKETARNVAGEAATEGAQAMLQSAGQRAGRGEDPMAFTSEDWAGALDQAIVGGLAGGAMGGSVEAVNASVPAAVDAAGRAVRATADAGRWAWDKTGSVRQALRERIRTAAEKRRTPLDTMDGGADPGAQDAPADLGARAGAAAKQAFDTAGTLFDKAKQGLSGAAQRFRRAQDDLTQADDLDAAADGAMNWLQANVLDQQAQPPAARHPYTAKAGSPLQAWALSKMNPAFLDTLPEVEALRLGRAVEKYANSRDLTGAENRLLRDAIAQPDSGLSRDMLNASALVAEKVTQPKSKAFKDAEGNAPHLAQPRGNTDDMVALAQDPGGSDVAGLDIAGFDSQDSAARIAKDWNSGFSEQAASDGIAPIDQLNSLRTSLTEMEARLGKQEARSSEEYRALRAQGEQLRQRLRDQLEKGVVFTRNGASDAARSFWAKKTAERWAVPLMDPKTVTLKDGKNTIQQPQVVDLPVVVGRALAAINAEGTSEKDIPLDMALARGLSELSMLGYRIDPKQLPLGDMPVAGRTLRVTPAMRRKLAGQFDGRAYGPFPYRPTPVFDDAGALDSEYGRDDTEGKYLDEPSSAEALTAQEYAQGAREPAPGARAPGGGFVPTLDVVSDVNVKSPHAKALADWRKARKAATTPAQRRAVNIRFGQQIGADVLAREAQNGQINPRRLEAEMARLTAPDGTLALRMLERAARGDFDNVSVRHLPSDKAERVKGDEADPRGLRVLGPQDKREFVRRTKAQAEVREKREAKLGLPTSRVGAPEPRAIGEYKDPPAPSAENLKTAMQADARSKAMDAAGGRKPDGAVMRARAAARAGEDRADRLRPQQAPAPRPDGKYGEKQRRRAVAKTEQAKRAFEMRQAVRQALGDPPSRPAGVSRTVVGPEELARLTSDDVRAQAAQLRKVRASKESGVQNDELTPEQSDAIDAGAKSAAGEGRHNLKAERTMLNTILGMLGITEQISALRTLKDADERGNKGGTYTRRSRTVSINPNLHGAERVEVLLHELGHHVIWNEIAKHVDGGFEGLHRMSLAESLDVLAKGNPKLYAALRKDFDQWNTNGRPSQAPTHRYLRGVTNGLARTFKDDHHAFHEWFADNVARSLAGKRPVVGVVGKFFAKIATQLRKAWSVISATPSLKPAPSVDAWVKQMLNANVAAVKEATGQAAPQAKAEAAVRGAVAAQAAKAGPIKYTMENLGDLVALIETVLPVESRQLLDRVFARPVVLSRLQQIYADNQVVKRMLDHPSQGASARVAFGYLAWQDGLLKTGPQGQNALIGLGDSILKLFGAAGDGALAQRTLYDIQTGAVQRFKAAGKTYSARDLAARNGGNFQRALNWVNRAVESSPASNALSAFWTGNNDRMRGSGVSALRKLATMLDRPQGTIGESNPGLITNLRVQTARWNRQMREIMEPLTDRQQARVLRALQRRAKAGDKAYDALPENARGAVDQIRGVFDAAYQYQREAGYTEDDLGRARDYMPVIMDIRNATARAKLKALYSKPEYARDVAIAAGFVKPDAKGLYDGAEIKAVTSDPEQMAKAVEYLVRAAANDGQTPTPAGGKDRFHFRHQNTQLSGFIYARGNPDDIKTLSSLQTRDPGEVFARYFAPMVRWTEMSRMFGEVEPVLNEDGDPVIDPATGREIAHMNPRAKLDTLLEQAKAQGATDDDVAFADNAVRAALGVYGADGSPTIAAVSPWAAEKLKGRKAQSVIEGMQAYQNARLLPLALMSNLVDPVGIAVRTGGEFGVAWDGFKEGMGFVRAALAKDPVAAKRLLKELEDIDVSEDFLPALAATPVFEGSRTGKARAVNDFVFKWNGVQTWITATRVMAMYAGHKFLLRHAQMPNEHSERYLQELGLTAKDVVEDTNNPGKVEINDKTRAALRQFVDEAILRPNSQQAPLWMSDPYMGIVSQYKMFAYAIWEQIGGRIKREVTQGNMRVVAAALMYLPVIVMAELTREMIQTAGEGDDRRKEWGPIEYTKLAADRSGLLGPQYQILGDIKGDIDRARLPGTSQLGPSINQGSNVVDALEGQRNLGKEFESALPGSPLYRKWNDGTGPDEKEAA